ncbi:Poly(ADP-ribose) polymerase, catalytic domain containing protein [Parasponia andersonii]|uniref:Poly(ADP-ribose) polymerase, catalytic domain containing protein n=1 Tax=Parasponia andersonii TaxID=3476 RepID=A0A2P5BYL0_PARAD|nr:Poly(ADP-ribose) polymerase, catalytic domain containing protein [Parasponia andersonii]
MASGWVKSLQCKSRAFEDVYQPKPKNLIPSASCRHSVRNIKDVIDTTTKYRPRKPKTTSPSPPQKKPTSKPSRPAGTEPGHGQSPSVRTRLSASTRSASRSHDGQFLPSALTELPAGHPSRNVVEIIFHTSWSPKSFSGRIEMIFKVQNGSKAVARFEEYRELVKGRAGSAGEATCKEENARCVADGNEVMGFHCLGPTSGGGEYDACSGAWAFPGGKGSVICTYSGSGGAHESAGGGRGMRAMLVCRVIAGRVSKPLGIDSLLNDRVGFDSVSGDNDELLVFDSRAVLPCFLIIYKL